MIYRTADRSPMYSRQICRHSKPHERVSQSTVHSRAITHETRRLRRIENAHLALHFRWRGFPILLLGGCLCGCRGGFTPGRSSNDEGGVGAFTRDATVRGVTTGGGGGGRHARRRSKSRRRHRFFDASVCGTRDPWTIHNLKTGRRCHNTCV